MVATFRQAVLEVIDADLRPLLRQQAPPDRAPAAARQDRLSKDGHHLKAQSQAECMAGPDTPWWSAFKQ